MRKHAATKRGSDFNRPLAMPPLGIIQAFEDLA
jgi:hypothetical protein